MTWATRIGFHLSSYLCHPWLKFPRPNDACHGTNAMNLKTTWILFGILIGFLGIFVLVQSLSKPPGHELLLFPSTKGKDVKSSEIVSVEIKRTKEEPILFERTKAGESWRLVKPFATRVEDGPVKSMIDE